MTKLLSVENAHISYGKVEAVRGVTLDVNANEIVTIVGANGAGKTTLLGAIAGVAPPWRGDIFHRGEPIARRSCEERVAAGIVLCPEGRRLFPEMTVEENLRLGGYKVEDRAAMAQALERVFDLFPRIADRRGQRAGTLSGGEQQMVAIGRGSRIRNRINDGFGSRPYRASKFLPLVPSMASAGSTRSRSSVKSARRPSMNFVSTSGTSIWRT